MRVFRCISIGRRLVRDGFLIERIILGAALWGRFFCVGWVLGRRAKNVARCRFFVIWGLLLLGELLV